MHRKNIWVKPDDERLLKSTFARASNSAKRYGLSDSMINPVGLLFTPAPLKPTFPDLLGRAIQTGSSQKTKLDHNADDVYATFFYKDKIILQTRSCTIVRNAHTGEEYLRVRRNRDEFNTESFLHKNELIIKVYVSPDKSEQHYFNDAYHYVTAINLETGHTRELLNQDNESENRLINRLIITGDRLIAKIGLDKIGCWDMEGNRLFGFRIGSEFKYDLDSRLFATGTKVIYVNGAHVSILDYKAGTETNLTLTGKINTCCLHHGSLICGMADSAKLLEIDLNNGSIVREIDLSARYASKKILSVCSQKHSVFLCTENAIFRLNSMNWSARLLSVHNGEAFRSLELHSGCVILHGCEDKMHYFDIWRIDNLAEVGELSSPDVVHTYAVHDTALTLASNKGVTRIDFDVKPEMESLPRHML